MKIAAVQMKAETGAVKANMALAEDLVGQAFFSGAEMVILPEFFTSAMAFHPAMLKAARPLEGRPMQLLKSFAKQHGGPVGGSFIAVKGKDAFNTFVLAFPDGRTWLHDKDMPTMWENCYYRGGRDDGVLDTPIGPVGAAVCWEFVRTKTARRLRGRVNLIVGGSCWWGLPEKRLPGFSRKLDDHMLEIMKETPGKMAAMTGAPVVHAAHAGEFQGRTPLIPGFPFKSRLLGETMITDSSGVVLARMSRKEGNGFVIADIDMSRKTEPSMPVPESFWIPKLPIQIRAAWGYQNMHGKAYYRLVTRRLIRRGRLNQ